MAAMGGPSRLRLVSLSRCGPARPALRGFTTSQPCGQDGEVKLPARDWEKFAPPPPAPTASRPASERDNSRPPRRRDGGSRSPPKTGFGMRREGSEGGQRREPWSQRGGGGGGREEQRSRRDEAGERDTLRAKPWQSGKEKWQLRGVDGPPPRRPPGAGRRPWAQQVSDPETLDSRLGKWGVRDPGPFPSSDNKPTEPPGQPPAAAATDEPEILDKSLAFADTTEDAGDVDPSQGFGGPKRGKIDRRTIEAKKREQRNSRPSKDGEIVDKALRMEREMRAREKEARRMEMQMKRKEEAKRKEKRVYVPSTVSVARLAGIFGKKLFHLQTRMNQLDMTEEQRRGDHVLTAEQACNIALEFGFDPVIDDEASFDILPEPEAPDGTPPSMRPPVVTIMGHVDHGKTTLLDSLRHTAVAAGEAGGITQHIGAFSVPLSSLVPSPSSAASADDAESPSDVSAEPTITFLDTPGHAAFTAMRARGAGVTDLIVLVVAADDGVMPQTREVIDLWKAEGDKVGLVVAINKIDKPGIDLSKIKEKLGAEGILLEEDGGDIPSVRVSGLQKIGLDSLVETLSTMAELRELRARTTGKAEGYVLESNVDKGRGNVATVLISRGILRTGAAIVAGHVWCRVRTMTDSAGRVVTEAGPGTPVVITGWRELPTAGDQLLEAIGGEESAKKCIANRLREEEQNKIYADLESINSKRQTDREAYQAEKDAEREVRETGGNVFLARLERARRERTESEQGKFKEMRLVIKGDVSGTVEAVEGALTGIGNKEAGVKVVGTGVGEVTESDVMLAEAAGATVIGFNVAVPRNVQTVATENGVPVVVESVIYRLIETVRARTAALLPPKIEHRITGEATVLQLFSINVRKRETIIIAGCRCVNGTLGRNEGVRVMRGPDREIIFEGTIETLKHEKKDVAEIRKGMECGIGLHGFQAIQEGDEICTFTTTEVPRQL